MKTKRYIISDKGKPIPEPDLTVWAEWFGNFDNRRVAEDHVGHFRISTVFLGLDHQFGDGPPILWETMVFNDKCGEPARDVLMDRCSGSREQAEAMHAKMVRSVKKVIDSSNKF